MVAVLMVLTSHEDMGNTGKKTGWYLPELAHPWHEFKKAGYNMTFVSPKGGKAPMVRNSKSNCMQIHVIFQDPPPPQKFLWKFLLQCRVHTS